MLPASFADETAMTSLSARQMHVSHLSSGPQRFESLIHHNRQLVDDGFTAVEQVWSERHVEGPHDLVEDVSDRTKINRNLELATGAVLVEGPTFSSVVIQIVDPRQLKVLVRSQ